MNPILILARMTFRQAIRRRIVLTGLLLGICFLVVFSIGFHMINTTSMQPFAAATGGGKGILNVLDRERDNALTLAGLYAVTFLSIAMAALLGADTLAGEINSGTIQIIVTKPIRRSDVVFGKWLGFAGLLGLYLVLMAGGAVAERMGAIRVHAPPPGCRAGTDLPRKPAGDDGGAAVFQPPVRTGDRRRDLRPVRHGIHRRMDRADRLGAPEPDGCEGRHPDQPDHPQRGPVAPGCLRNAVAFIRACWDSPPLEPPPSRACS